jgi:hypothetical protein
MKLLFFVCARKLKMAGYYPKNRPYCCNQNGNKKTASKSCFETVSIYRNLLTQLEIK